MNNPLYYHLHHQNEVGDLLFWKALSKERGSPILELGCGTGRVLHPLIQNGLEVVGIDINQEALKFLSSQASRSLQSQPMVFQADIQYFRLDRRFSLIFMACNTLSTLPQAKRWKVYSQINDHLLTNGVFAASIPNPHYLTSLPEEGEPEVETLFDHPITGNPVQVSSGWQRVDQTVIVQWFYDHLQPDGRVERETVEITHYLTTLVEYQSELRAADLQLKMVYGDFNRTEYLVDSPYLIMVACRGS
jgi:SAM-dependent methyltransferase